MPCFRAACITLVVSVGLFVLDLAPLFAGEIVRGPVRVCRKPMLAGSAAFAEQVRPGPDAWTKLAERQAEEARVCYVAGDIELIEKGAELDVGLNTRCMEWRAKANDDEVYVVVGTNRTWGRCP